MKYLGGFAIFLGTLIVIAASSPDQPDILTGIAGLILCAVGVVCIKGASYDTYN
jgi:drug/metabolite transporter (DMT)-like permease